jgi:HEAT repeat protein
MPESPDEAKKNEELKKLANIASDMDLDSKLRFQAIDRLGEMGNHEALLALLNLAANDKMGIDDRDLALKRAREIVRKGR